MCASHRSGVRLRFALCALRLGSKRLLHLSALSAFNNTGLETKIGLRFTYKVTLWICSEAQTGDLMRSDLMWGCKQ